MTFWTGDSHEEEEGPLLDCPLCHSDHVQTFALAYRRCYLECEGCRLIYLTPEQRLGPAAEKARYEAHENHPTDEGYRAFLSRLAIPLVEQLPAGSEGLDYGCGPGPTLSLMLEEQGFQMTIYDPFFAPDLRTLQRSYDFITCTETAEHFFHPGDEFDRLDRLLRPGGWLALMTEMLEESRSFTDWHYPRDPTHVAFYRPVTMQWIAARFRWSPTFPRPNIVLFRKDFH